VASTATTFDTDCKLMLHMDGIDASTTFTDSSSSTKTVTANGNAQIDTAQSVYGGASGLFDNAGDYLSIADSADWDLGTGDLTIDFRYRPNANFADGNFIDTFLAPDTNDTWIVFRYNFEHSRFEAVLFPNTRTFAFSASKDTWYHVALTRSGTNLRLFVDGTQAGSTLTDSTDVQSSSSIFIGSDHAQTPTQFMGGHLDEFRFIKGTAVWTANFTPPTSAYTDANALNFDEINTFCMVA